MFSIKDAVLVDERFISWIFNSSKDFNRFCQNKRYVVVSGCGEGTDLRGYSSLKELTEKEEKEGLSFGRDHPRHIFDLKAKKELKFSEEYKLTILP